MWQADKEIHPRPPAQGTARGPSADSPQHTSLGPVRQSQPSFLKDLFLGWLFLLRKVIKDHPPDK